MFRGHVLRGGGRGVLAALESQASEHPGGPFPSIINACPGPRSESNHPNKQALLPPTGQARIASYVTDTRRPGLERCDPTRGDLISGGAKGGLTHCGHTTAREGRLLRKGKEWRRSVLPNRQGSPGVRRASERGKTPPGQPIPSGFSVSSESAPCRLPVGNLCTMVTWQQERGACRVTASP